MKQSPKPQPRYQCTQAELYAICRIAWANCLIHLARFFQFKTFYTQQFIDDRVAEVDDAASLPDSQMRGEASEIAHIQLKEKADLCLIAWQSLKAYIQDSFTNQQKPKLEAAGSKLYHKAANYDWESITKLMGQATQFITDNNTALLNNGGMPPTFQAEVDALELDFNTIYQTFQIEQQGAEVLTTTKINANNLIFDKLMKMLSDGKKIFRLERAIQEQFIWEQILELVTPTTPQPKETLIFSSKQNPVAPLGIAYIGADGETINHIWGDNTPDTLITVNSLTPTVASHTYGSIGNYTIKATGIKEAFKELFAPDNQFSAINIPVNLNFRRIDLNNNYFTSLYLPPTNTDLIDFQINNNDLDLQSVNNFFITVNSFGTSNGQISMQGGTTPAPTGQGLIAMNELIARGWTILTN